MENLSECRVQYRGTVQGVGFRYAAQEIVSRWPKLKGYVRNQADGSVELLLQGRKVEIQPALRAILSRWGSYIRTSEERWGEPSRRWNGFAIEKST